MARRDILARARAAVLGGVPKCRAAQIHAVIECRRAGVGGQAMSETRWMSRGVRLRPVVESELADLVRLLWDPLAPGAFQWFGFRMKTAREIERRCMRTGSSAMSPRS